MADFFPHEHRSRIGIPELYFGETVYVYGNRIVSDVLSTNSTIKYKACITCLKAALEMSIKSQGVRDSILIISQLFGQWDVQIQKIK